MRSGRAGDPLCVPAEPDRLDSGADLVRRTGAIVLSLGLAVDRHSASAAGGCTSSSTTWQRVHRRGDERERSSSGCASCNAVPAAPSSGSRRPCARHEARGAAGKADLEVRVIEDGERRRPLPERRAEDRRRRRDLPRHRPRLFSPAGPRAVARQDVAPGRPRAPHRDDASHRRDLGPHQPLPSDIRAAEPRLRHADRPRSLPPAASRTRRCGA